MMKYNDNKLIKNQKTKLNSFYGKSQDSFYCLKQSNKIIQKFKFNNKSQNLISNARINSDNTSVNNKNHFIYKITPKNKKNINLANPSNNSVPNIISSDINIEKTYKIDSSHFSSRKEELMGNLYSSKSSVKHKDIYNNNLNCSNNSRGLKRDLCSKMIEPPLSELDDNFIDKKRPKLNHVESKVINDFTTNKSLEKRDQLNGKSNGLTKVCTCVKDKKKCIVCINSSPILLDEDDSASSSAENSNQSISTDKLFEYPKSSQTGRLTITKHDVKCLQPTEYLNDVIIDFYLKFINFNLLSKLERDKIHIFSSFFYSRLISVSPKIKCKNKTTNSNPDIAIQRHSRISNWTRNIDIFEKDYILIPINQHKHWFLAIICFPNKCKEIYDHFRNELDDSKINEMISDYILNMEKRPCILIFDSLCPNPERWDVSTILREYLQVEWNLRKNSCEGSNIFKKKIMRGNSVKCPQQANSYDCGCYLLIYAEYFFTRPIKSFHLPIRSCERWFTTAEASKMRDKIKNIIRDLTKPSIRD